MADVDGDGRLDLLTGSDNCCDLEPGFYWFRRGADGRFTAQPKVHVKVPRGDRPFLPRFRASLVDWDGDDRPDVVAVMSKIRPAVYLSDGPWSPTAGEVVAGRPVAGSPDDLSTQPCVVDWDRDGRLDLVVAGFRAQGEDLMPVFEVAWHRNLSAAGGPRLGGPQRLMILAADEFDGLNAGDYDDDGWPDLIVGYHRGKYDNALRRFETSGVLVYTRRPHDAGMSAPKQVRRSSP